MHELPIIQGIVSTILEKAREAGATRVTRVNLTIGELSDVTDDSARFYFETLAKDTIAAGATVAICHSPVKLRCRKCKQVFSPGELDWNCPVCRDTSIEVVSGRECALSSIDIE
jgi:hydrogenase nickel incorporation protein HypA/HybF